MLLCLFNLFSNRTNYEKKKKIQMRTPYVTMLYIVCILCSHASSIWKIRPGKTIHNKNKLNKQFTCKKGIRLIFQSEKFSF